MTVRRLYIYRRGDTDQCAIMRIKDYASLPLGVADEWRFWMQIGPLQAQGGRCGFNIQAAIDDIVGKGYCLFRGSDKLLGRRIRKPSRAVGSGRTKAHASGITFEGSSLSEGRGRLNLFVALLHRAMGLEVRRSTIAYPLRLFSTSWCVNRAAIRTCVRGLFRGSAWSVPSAMKSQI